jgi:hypothetical protein
MEVSGQLHAPGALPSGKEPLSTVAQGTRSRMKLTRHLKTLIPNTDRNEIHSVVSEMKLADGEADLPIMRSYYSRTIYAVTCGVIR